VGKPFFIKIGFHTPFPKKFLNIDKYFLQYCKNAFGKDIMSFIIIKYENRK